MRVAILVAASLVFSLLLSCGAARDAAPAPEWAYSLPETMPYDGRLTVQPHERQEPALDLRLPWGNDRTSLGWGAMHFWARPALDHVRVTAILDAPADQARWEQCVGGALSTTRGTEKVDARYIGRPFAEGPHVYDAVQVSFRIDQLRALAGNDVARGSICGDPFELTLEQHENLRRFIVWFDRIATPAPSGEQPFYRDVGPRPERLPGEESEAPEPVEA